MGNVNIVLHILNNVCRTNFKLYPCSVVAIRGYGTQWRHRDGHNYFVLDINWNYIFTASWPISVSIYIARCFVYYYLSQSAIRLNGKKSLPMIFKQQNPVSFLGLRPQTPNQSNHKWMEINEACAKCCALSISRSMSYATSFRGLCSCPSHP